MFFYKRTGEREVGYKRLMTVCYRSLLRNSATDDIDGSVFIQLIEANAASNYNGRVSQRDARADRDSPSVTSPYIL